MFITNQPHPVNFASHRRNRRNHLPTFQRTNQYMETPNDHRD